MELIARRRSVISQLIDQVYLDSRQVPPTGRTLAAMVARWDRHLVRNHVPTRRLQAIYDRAVDQFKSQRFITIYSILEAWDLIRAEEAANPSARVSSPCDYEHNNETDMLVELSSVTSSKTALLPCPNCRPEAFAAARQQEEKGGAK